MSKRYVEKFLDLLSGTLRDAVSLDPRLTEGVQKDVKRLATLSVEHGDALFTVLLPDLGKAFLAMLDQRFLTRTGLPLSRSINTRTMIPRLFSGLWLKVFDINGCLRHDADPNFVLLLRQLFEAGKKFESSCPPKAVYKTVEGFYDVESGLFPPSPFWDLDWYSDHHYDHRSLGDVYDSDSGILERPIGFNQKRGMLDLCQRVADRVVSDTFGGAWPERAIFRPEEWAFRHGPGATSEAKRGGLFKYSFRAWNPRLDSVWQYDQFGVPNSSVLADSSALEASVQFIELHSRLIAVPKTMKGPRLIAAEPSSNQWCQQNVLDYICGHLQRQETRLGGSIDFRRQDLSGASALSASESRSHATIDLKDASDRLSCWHVEAMFRGNSSLLNAMAACRTRYIYNAIDHKRPKIHKLRKFATMGSALTFPVQSLVFCIIALTACCKARGLDEKHWAKFVPEVRVFGDDIIIPEWAYTTMLELLEHLRFKVNTAKSFADGNFRESCGVDGFKGYDVTPVKVKAFAESDRPGSVISAVDTANLLHKKGLWYTAEALRSSVDKLISRLVPVVQTGSGFWGDESFVGPKLDHLKRRWNHDLQRVEMRAFQPKAVSRKSRRFESHANLLQYFTEDPSGSVITNWASGFIDVADAGISRRWVAFGTP